MRYGIGVAVTAVLMVAGPAHAEGDANAAKGLVVDHCISCHRVPGYVDVGQSEAINAPDFQAIADDPATYGEARLRTFLRKPHYPMRGFNLSPSDINNILAFIAGLKSN